MKYVFIVIKLYNIFFIKLNNNNILNIVLSERPLVLVLEVPVLRRSVAFAPNKYWLDRVRS